MILLKKEGIKDKYINNKNELNSKLGPGTYNAYIKKKFFQKKSKILEAYQKRFIIYDNIDSNKSNFSYYNNYKQYNSLVISNNSNEDKKEKK